MIFFKKMDCFKMEIFFFNLASLEAEIHQLPSSKCSGMYLGLYSSWHIGHAWNHIKLVFLDTVKT